MSNPESQTPERAYPWRELLQRWSDEWLDPILHEQERSEPFSSAVRAARWLGGEGARAEEIAQLEKRLGVALPSSYRQFLQTSNGWLDTTSWIERLLPTREVGWARDLDPESFGPRVEAAETFEVSDELYYVYGEEQDSFLMRDEYLPHMLKISHTPGATDVYLLNPLVVTPDGEWEAWYHAHWLPGARRYRSFWDLMNDEYEIFHDDD
ncbi:SMI1/KNR4 family protein [Kitasatospora sp. NBC_00070]|uniref:SMI1/KNR4 family protein n=1 Tax=Kitasatospora sp. NBC_00070 TaxID=2975962 RepID=UPI00324371C9